MRDAVLELPQASTPPRFVTEGHKLYSSNCRFLILDFETTTLEYGTAINPTNRLLLGCWRVVEPDGSYTDKHCFGSEYEMGELLEDIEASEFVVAHNAKFELQWLKRCGINLRKVLPCCTMLMAWVVNGNLRKPLSLKELCAEYGLEGKEDLVSILIGSGVPCDEIPPSWLLRYCRRDVDQCHKLFEILRSILDSRDQLHVLHTRNLTCAVLADIEFNGMKLDERRVTDEAERLRKSVELSSRTLEEIAKGINLNSPIQLGQFLYEGLGFSVPTDRRGNQLLTASGRYPTDQATLLSLEAKTDNQRAFITAYREFNESSTALSKGVEFFVGVCNEYGGVFRAEFNQGRTGTHRLSSSGRPLLFEGEKKKKGAQFQNLDRDYKKFFRAKRDGWLIAETDGAQLEFRMAAEFARDPVAIPEIINWFDVHSVTADTLLKAGHELFVAEPNPKKRRQMAKAFTFRPLTHSGR